MDCRAGLIATYRKLTAARNDGLLTPCFLTAPSKTRAVRGRNQRPNPYPLCGGVRPQAAGWFPAPCADAPNVQTPIPSVEGYARRRGVVPRRSGRTQRPNSRL
ncbi:MAG: hypothetical protein LBM98_09940 [Oscillospiraceae bacterium]|nr:hypothetical protein [Oscillospiraceae bacterium]